jgi:hypothetical protein
MCDVESGPVSSRQLQEGDLDSADRIFRLAFGTFLGLPNPKDFSGDSDYIRSRWLANPAATVGAELDGSLVGSNFVTLWGSVGFFGPLTVHPFFWEGHREKASCTDRGDAQWLAGHPCWFVHFWTQSEAHRALPEVRLLAAIPHHSNVQTSCE